MNATLLWFLAVGFLLATALLIAICCLIAWALPAPKPRPIPSTQTRPPE